MKTKKQAHQFRRYLLAGLAGLLTITVLGSCAPPEEPPSSSTTSTTSTTSSIPDDSTTLSVTGHLEYFGEAQVGPRQIRVRTYGTSGETIPGGFLITVNAAAPFGSFSTVIPLGDDVTSVNLIAELETPEGTAYFPSDSYSIVTDTTNTGVYNTHGSFVDQQVSFLRDGEPYSQSTPLDMIVQAYDADGEPYGLATSTSLYFDPWGSANLSHFVAYDSFAGGDSSTDPATLEFYISGFDNEDDEAVYTVDLDQGAAFYSGSPIIDIDTGAAAE